MSIRLRLTLLYSAILAFTLVAFGVIIFVIQSRVTLDAIKTTLARNAQTLVATDRRFPGRPEGGLPSAAGTLRGRWAQTLNPDGTVNERTPDLADTPLPLSSAGLNAVKGGATWTETAEVEGESLLIMSQPLTDNGRVVRIVQVAIPLTERDDSLNALRLILIGGSSLALVVAFVAGWALAGMALRPVHQITQTAQAIGAERDFSRRVQHTGPTDEVGQLALTFNGMLTELESAYRQVEQSLHTQRRFVADASHELRTPLTTIRGNVDLLRQDPPIGLEDRTDALAETQDEVDRLIRLVNQLLALARADAGRPLQHEPVALGPLLQDLCRQAQLIAPEREVTCGEPLNITVLGDRDALKQVLLILVDNALVHTPPSAEVRLDLAPANAGVAIHVRDSGPGIAPDALAHIFERFYRSDPSRSGGGTGLGLAIAKELIQAQGGTLTVESAPGKGSVFTVWLPQESA